MSEPRDRTYVRHILDAIVRIETYLDGVDRDDFLENGLLQDGVLRQLQIIGEAAKRLSSSFREETAEIPWADVAGMRDKIVHDYFGVDFETVWETAVRDVQFLKRAERRPFRHQVVVRRTKYELPDPGTENGRPQGHSGQAGSTDAPGIQELYTMLAENEGRNRKIVDDVVEAVRAGRTAVVLTERRKHVDALAELLSNRLPHVFVLAGGMGRRRRRRLMDTIASVPPSEPRVILSTGRYLGEGFDDERLDTLFLALPVSWRGTIAQYAGRLHRVHDGKRDVVIFDYVDARVPVLARMHERRRAGYSALGYEIGESVAADGQLSFVVD